jgi:hypothetical protein
VPAGTPSGSVCPICGALEQPGDGQAVGLDGRPSQSGEALELWIAHCLARNTALQVAARALAEQAALARKLAAGSRARGDLAAAARIEAEADSAARYYQQIQTMLEGLEPRESEPA